VYLPASKRLDVARGAQVEPPQARGGDETVLVVEDDEGLLELAATVLEGGGYVVIRTTDPRRALEVVATEQRPVDLLVLDVVMPFMSGPELARRLAELGHDLPTIFMSGYSGDTVVRNGLLEVVEGYLDKPFAPQLLLERVRAALDRRAARSVAA